MTIPTRSNLSCEWFAKHCPETELSIRNPFFRKNLIPLFYIKMYIPFIKHFNPLNPKEIGSEIIPARITPTSVGRPCFFCSRLDL